MQTLVIGGTGHIGTWLVPRLVRDGHQVVVLTRGQRRPYRDDDAWQQVETVLADRSEEESRGVFGARVADLGAEVVIDLTSFTVDSTRQLVEALQGRVQHFLHCGTLWVHGPSRLVPTTEDAVRHPITDYGRAKARIEGYLHQQASAVGFPVTLVHPGHISGPGWVPINPAGNLDVDVFQRLVDGRELVLPDLGMATLQHVHADDVAGVFMAALQRPGVSIGESFHAASATAITLQGYAEEVAAWFGRSANLSHLPFDQWRQTVSEQDAAITADHLAHSPCASMDKAQRLLGFTPRPQLDVLREAVDWLVDQGRVTVA